MRFSSFVFQQVSHIFNIYIDVKLFWGYSFQFRFVRLYREQKKNHVTFEALINNINIPSESVLVSIITCLILKTHLIACFQLTNKRFVEISPSLMDFRNISYSIESESNSLIIAIGETDIGYFHETIMSIGKKFKIMACHDTRM